MPDPLSRVASRTRRLLRRSVDLRPAPSAPAPGAAVLDPGLRAGLGIAPPPRGALVVVLATAGDESPLVAEVLARFANHPVRVIAERAEPEWALEQHRDVELRRAVTLLEINWVLKQVGPVDVIVDLTTDPALGHDTTWRELFFHLRHRGLFVTRLRSKDGPPPGDVRLAELLGRIGTARAAHRESSVAQVDQPYVRATAEVLLRRDVVAAVKRGDHFLKLRQDEVDRFLPQRNVPASARLLAVRRGGVHRSLARVVSHGRPAPWGELPAEYAYPEVRMREYTGDLTVATHSLLHTDATILPESFRYFQALPLNHVKTQDVSPQFAQVPADLRSSTRLEGSYYFLDTPFPGHFGHVMTETLSRLWGWDEAKRSNPELKAILRLRWPNERLPALEQSLLGAYGIAPDDLVLADAPVRVSSVVGVTPMFHNYAPHHANPAMAAVYARIGANLAVPPAEPRPRIFVSRPAGLVNRPCRNVAEVEAFFVARGFAVVHPERLSMAEQAGLFAAAEVVAGFAGSAMFNLMFCRAVRRVVLLTHDAYDARNEYLIASVTGVELHYFWSEPERPHPEGGWDGESFESGWTFDLDRDGAELDAVLHDA